jgi:diguanylate cyclase (GGDEF)-like protein
VFSGENIRILESFIGKHNVGLVTLQIDNFYSIVGMYGEDVGFRLLEVLEDEALTSFAHYFPDCGLITTQKVGISENVFCFRLPAASIGSLANGALSFRINLRNNLNNKVLQITGRHLDVLVGHSWIGKEQDSGFHQVLFKAFCDAHRVATLKIDPSKLQLHREFVEILEKCLLGCVYQPVVDFSSGDILGWEAFIRGPKEGHFHEPLMLLDYAVEIGKIGALDKKCREQAVRGLGEISPNQYLFMNIHSQTLNDPAFTPASTLELIESVGLKPENIVLEFTERNGVQDFSLLLQTLDQYRNQGFKIALDDVGAGHSSLRSLPQIRPNFIKIDVSLVRGIDFNPFKRTMVETFIIVAEKIGCQVIAEGVETETELSSLVSMGVHYGQGFFLTRPSFPKPTQMIEVPVKASFSDTSVSALKCSTPVEMLVQPAVVVSQHTAVCRVKGMIGDKPPMSSVVVVDGNKPVGLLMNYSLDRRLGTKYGVSLFYDREVSRLMDPSPLIVGIDMPVEEVAKVAMQRDNQKIYDDIIVTKDGDFVGTVSVQKMLDTLAKVQVEMAKGANPLTGLPGNVAIEQEINRRARVKTPSSLVYIDLDNFKVYNDVYGFENGDKVILFTSQVLVDVLKDEGSQTDFLGHVGGDDFVIISEQGSAERICKAIIDKFEKQASKLYNQEDRKRGFILGKGRDGVEREFSLISVSIGIVDCEFKCSFTMDEMSHRVAEVKKYSKSIPGNSYVKDRRSPLGCGPIGIVRPIK